MLVPFVFVILVQFKTAKIVSAKTQLSDHF